MSRKDTHEGMKLLARCGGDVVTDRPVEWKGFCEQPGKIPVSPSLRHRTKVTDRKAAHPYEVPLGP